MLAHFLLITLKTRTDLSIWQLSSSHKRSDDKYTLKLTLITAKQAEYMKSITKFFDHSRTKGRDVYKPEISRLHDNLATERKIK
uniref:Signal peptidase complex subunit 2 n=1 Tax=Lynx canadensis TaxID=61383 RepID=A0A667GT96_LYNCA